MPHSYKTFITALWCMGCSVLVAQDQKAAQAAGVGTYLESERWIQFDRDQRMPAQDLWAQHGQAMGLGPRDEMTFVKSEKDRIGWTHDRYQQMHNGVPVELAIYRVHSRGGQAVRGNGEIARDVQVDVSPAISRDEALAIALQYVGARTYYWEIAPYEDMKKLATGDPQATFYPEGELLIADGDFDLRSAAQYRLTWKFDIFSADPDGRRWVYVDAHTGAIVKELNVMHDSGHPGLAETRYSGMREIVADSTGNGFILRDVTRGQGVETYDMRDTTEGGMIGYFVDDDNYWANANERADDAATDAHWAAEQYYDYLLLNHGFHSYNNLGSKLISLIHYGKSWRNASWAGFWSRYGDADGDPWTYIDVVGHEFTHGFTWATSALLYTGESGALNESLSDIFGEALERYAKDTIDWHATPAPVDTIRSYIDPKALGDPDTYHGENWEFTSSDNYGVHTNSGVQNHWFYLLVEGGSGTNDNGHDYEVTGIGFDDAMDIVFRNATVYLFPTAGYFDARQGSLHAAEDLFGPCSFQYHQVANAWHAVGVGDRSDMQDFTILDVERYDICTVGATAPVTMTIKHLGCDTTGPVTLVFTLIKSNPLRTVRDTLDIPEGVGPGEVFTYTFSQELDFSRTGEHSLMGRVTYAGDPHNDNDVAPPVIVHNLLPVAQQDFRFHTLFAPRTFRDSMAFIPGELADVIILPVIGRDSTHGIRVQGDRLRYALPIYGGVDVFDVNHRLGAQICICVDATGLEALDLQFDLRQTYSTELQDILGEEQPKSCAMRVVVDDTTELARYIPVTPAHDPWRTHALDLTDYLGQQFTLCFETRTYSDANQDPADVGDRVFLDNIRVMGVEMSSSVPDLQSNLPLVVYPNPASDMVFIDIQTEDASDAEVVVVDVNGRILLSQSTALRPGFNQVRLDVEALPAGVYVVEVRTAVGSGYGKVVVE